jgi:hypothetical protein
MEPSKPNPVTFKSLANGAFNAQLAGSEPIKTLTLKHMDIEYHQPDKMAGYFLLVNHNDPANPVKLYSTGMKRLCNQLDFAFKEASNLALQDPLPDDELYDCGIINRNDNMVVRLVLSTYKKQVFVWLRLYVLNETNEYLPTKRGVRFAISDDAQAISNFASEFPV